MRWNWSAVVTRSSLSRLLLLGCLCGLGLLAQPAWAQSEEDMMDDLNKPITDIELSIQDNAESKPTDVSDELLTDAYHSNYPSSFQDRIAMWRAPNIRYQPLYFEDVALERYGHTSGLWRQPLRSAAHFAASGFLLNYNLAQQRPWTCDSPYGFFRPGSPAPPTRPVWLWTR